MAWNWQSDGQERLKGSWRNLPKPAYIWLLKNLPSCFPAPVSLSTRRATWNSCCPATWLVFVPPASCGAIPVVLLPLHTSLTAGFEGQPPATGACQSLSSSLRVNSSLCPRRVAMFSPQWKLCFHMSLSPTAGTSVWAPVPLCVPVPLRGLL